MRHAQLREILEGHGNDYEDVLSRRTDLVQQVIGQAFPLEPKEAIVILCGLSHAELAKDGTPDSMQKVVYDSEKLRQIGKGVYTVTKDTLLVFGDHQYLSTPTPELEYIITQIRDDRSIIPQYMKNCLLYESVIPFTGSMRAGSLEPEKAKERKAKIQDVSAIGSFFTMIGILTIKFGKEKVVEELLVPKVFNGKSGIIEIITERIGNRRQ
ncbi:hypothetical protein CANTEDRAFT_91501 [Yamadazyma tenuis ATCC 10573]|uniref:Uncharacterized protein n=1 Tax=Candida tenuis (strain ATCC 10573 / BCRC 21748 / CBS 615 / JCM 9827 / NBRC 10315 / NRRL Y-1498 / VKM Y-70) TaxID=590646 RepID=G3AXB5_CANTC|nr:uncharacterized protein CANTEDRAFT_91501 [Yamadazyma tenuis ATCC 10573]EGV66333.1 hypothetical protein CANTEDRAFT_91501 [Yamadazyma tenuis ATCC 10573]